MLLDQVCGRQDKVLLANQRVDGVNDAIVRGEVKGIGMFGVVNLLQGRDVGFGVDLLQAALHGFDLALPNRAGGGHELAVAVAQTHPVGIDQGEMPNARTDETLGAPGANAAHAEQDDALACQALQGFGAQQQLGPVQDTFACSCSHTEGEKKEDAAPRAVSS